MRMDNLVLKAFSVIELVLYSEGGRNSSYNRIPMCGIQHKINKTRLNALHSQNKLTLSWNMEHVFEQ